MTQKITPWIILHIPHASRTIPQEILPDLQISDDALDLELNKLTDHYTDELFAIDDPAFASVRFPISRFIVDPERFEDDSAEPMSVKGQGVIYTHTTEGERFRKQPSPAERESLLESYYRPHHAKLTSLVNDALMRHGRSLVIDCHSFPNLPLPMDQDQNKDRPDICIGTDLFHTPQYIIDALVEQCNQLDWSVGINEPYAGTIVPTTVYKKDDRVLSVMIEVNRRLYLTDEPNDISKSADWSEVRAGVRSLIRRQRQWHRDI